MALDAAGNWVPVLPDQPAIPGCFCVEDVCDPTLLSDADAPAAAFDIITNGTFIVQVGADGMIRTSSDGVAWVTRDASYAYDFYAAAYGNGVYLIGGQAEPGFSPEIRRSTDAITWAPTESLGSVGASINGIAFGAGVFVAVVEQLDGDSQIRTSSDGIVWTVTTVVPEKALENVVFANSRFLVVGGLDAVITADNGIDWTTRNTGTSGVSFQDAAYGNGAWIITSGNTPTVYRSTNQGATWTPVPVPEAMRGIDFGGGVFVMQAAAGGAIYTSADGITWALSGLSGGENSLIRFYQDCQFLKGPTIPEIAYLVKQDFEGAGYDNGETWAEDIVGSSVVDEDYTGIVLAGDQSLRIVTAAAGASTRIAIATQDELWFYALVRPVHIETDGFFVFGVVLMGFEGAGLLATVSVNTDGTLRAGMNNTASTVNAMVNGTTYHVWAHFKKGSGANAVIDVAFSTTGTKPTSGNNFAEVTNGDVTSAVDHVKLGRETQSATCEYIFDKIRVAAFPIGDNPA